MMVHEIIASIVALSALASGIAAPGFDAVTHDGRKLTLSALHSGGPVMLVFLRGFS